MSRRIVIMGAAGRDFHVFNCLYRENKDFDVVAFTATQIPHIEDRRYPAELAGSLYPDGIPIVPEEDLDRILDEKTIDEVIFAYSDVSIEYLAERRDRVVGQGCRLSRHSTSTARCCHRKSQSLPSRPSARVAARARFRGALSISCGRWG